METDSEKKTKQYPKHCKILIIVSCTNDLNEYQLYKHLNEYQLYKHLNEYQLYKRFK